MHKKKILMVGLMLVLVLSALAGCKDKTETPQTGWNTGDVVDETPNDTPDVDPTETPNVEPTETPETPETPETDEEIVEQFEVDTKDYASVDMTLGRPMSSIYTYKLAPNKDKADEVLPSAKYTGLFTATSKEGKKVLLGLDMAELVYPVSENYKVLEPFTHEGKVYYRVQDNKTDWQPIPDEYCTLWWKPLGGYAVVDQEGKEVIPFGTFNYMDQFVEGKARALKEGDNDNYYIIDVKGETVRVYPKSEKITPYKLYPDGYVYTRSDLEGKHSHGLETWDGEPIVPYQTYKDDFFPKYLGSGTFLISDALLINGKNSGLVLYSKGKEPRTLPKDSFDVFSIESGKFVTGMITNKLAGPLAEWEYVVTDYAGKELLKQGWYDFSLGGWGDGYAVAKRGNKIVLLDSNCKEVKPPAGMELTGRYSQDAALFTVKVTKDFEMWRFAEVPLRYDNPVGVVDKDFNWVIPPGEVDYIRNLPLDSVDRFSEYKRIELDSAENKDLDSKTFLHIYPKPTTKE